MVLIRKLIIFCYLLFPLSSYSQSSVLNQEVTVNFSPVTKYEALKNLEKALGIFFSYKSDLLIESELIQIHYRNTTLQTILDKMFDNKGIEYIVMGRMIIIRATPQIKLQPENYESRNVISEKTNGSSESEIRKIQISELESLICESIVNEEAIEYLPAYTVSLSIRDSESQGSDCSSYLGSTTIPEIYYSNYSIFSTGILNRKQSVSNSANRPGNRSEKSFFENKYVHGCDFSMKKYFFRTGISVSPHISYGENKQFKFGIHGGIKQDIWYRQLIAVSLGFQLSKQRVSIDNENGTGPKKISSEILHYGIPVNLFISLFSNKNCRIYLLEGMYNYLFVNEMMPDSKNNLEWFKYINTGIGYEMKFNSKYVFQLEPFVRFSIGNNTDYKLLNKAGLSISFMYHY